MGEQKGAEVWKKGWRQRKGRGRQKEREIKFDRINKICVNTRGQKRQT